MITHFQAACTDDFVLAVTDAFCVSPAIQLFSAVSAITGMCELPRQHDWET